jgi:hypothetical protein
MAAAEFLVRYLYKPINLADEKKFFAVTETEHLVGGDDWVWTDDNAKVLEFLSRPEVWRRFPQQTVEVLRFVQSMCHGPFMFRRISTPRLELITDPNGETRYIHSLMHGRYDLQRGIVVAGIRFHDVRTADNLLLSDNTVEFTYNGRRFILDVEDAITAVEATQQGHVLTLRHSSELYFKPGRFTVRLGRIDYIYTIDARSMLIGVEVVLEVDRAAEVADVVLTIGHDQLSQGNHKVRYNTVATDKPGPAFTAARPRRHRLPAAGASYYSIAQAEIAGFALAVHSAPRGPGRLAEIDISVRERGRLHLVVARYRFDGPCRGARLVAGENKLLTAGGFYGRCGDYAALMRKAVADKPSQQAALDYSISYDYGAEINAIAKCFAVCSAESDLQMARIAPDELRAFFDQYLEFYFEYFVGGHYRQQNTIMSRQLAFVILGVVTMYRATRCENYLGQLQRLCDVLLDFEVAFSNGAGQPASGFPYGIASHRAVFVDGHSASLLALTQAARYISDPRFALAIDRGLAGYCLETSFVQVGDTKRKIDVLATSVDIDGRRHTENAYWNLNVGMALRFFATVRNSLATSVGIHRRLHTQNAYWNFNVGLALRFFAALRNSPDAALQDIAARHRDRIEAFELVLHRQLRKCITERDDCIEIRTAEFSAETNSETQPWVMLGLLGHPYD